ncbi:MAG: LLM class flavin-dependent oxidoreductase [Bacteroidetes bacterium]|nr:LLM class flavin-dependent oxidoreductase [Bacteroidota bacterium]
MELGIDSFAAVRTKDGRTSSPDERAQAIEELLSRIEVADEIGLDTFGIGEHHRPEYLDSASHILLAAAAARTKRIELISAVTVLSAADPVRVFQQLSTVDLISRGRAGVVLGRGSFSEAFPLFGYSFNDYEALFEEKLDLFLKLREEEHVTWEGKFRPALSGQGVYPRPYRDKLQTWIGVGGTPASFVRAGLLGIPLMVAIIGGETHRFRPLVDLYYRAGAEAGYSQDQLKVGVHSLGYVAETSEKAHAEFYPGYARTFTRIGMERGGGPVSRPGYDAQVGPTGALVVGSPDEVAEKIHRHSEALGGLVRFQLHMNVAELSHDQLLNSTRLLGEKVKPALG